MFNISFAGAKRPLWIYSTEKKEIETIEGTKRSVGGFSANKKKNPFLASALTCKTGDCLYLSSDGIPDQCNKKRKKFTTKRLHKILLENASFPPDQQKDILEKALDNYQGSFPQRDDISFWGVKIC